MPEAFAVVREAARRATGMRPFDVQVMGAVVLHQGSIAEMKTGEGKTLVATMPVYLNALAGRGRPRRHRERLSGRPGCRLDGPGIRVPGYEGGRAPERHGCGRAPGSVRGRHHLRDEHRVRLRLSARQHGPTHRPAGAARPFLLHRGRGRLHPDRRGADPAHHLRAGRARGQDLLRLRPHRPPSQVGRRRGLRGRREEAHRGHNRGGSGAGREGTGHRQHLRGPVRSAGQSSDAGAAGGVALFRRDVDYLVQDGEVKIIDEFTGRVLEGRRYSEGLHQAIEAGKASRSRRRTRPSPPSPCRTTSASTRRSPA